MRQAVRAIVVRDKQLLAMHRNKFGHVFYELVGGGIDPLESHEQALRREVKEETSLELGNLRLVLVEQAGKPFGTQYIYLCEYVGGEPVIQSNSDEAEINKLGQNLYTPVWLEVSQLPKVAFLSKQLQERLVAGIESGFPEKPEEFSSNAEYSEMVGE
jgi:8-oxo-dGTP pyrophosphatase MutT (NUDIX family)